MSNPEISRRQRGKATRRAAILTAAESLFSRDGYFRTTVEDIAQRAGVGAATVYTHFGTKQAIVEALIRPTLDAALAAAEKIIVDPPPDPGVAMATLISEYRHLRNDWSDRTLLRALSVPDVANGGVLLPLTREADGRCQRQIRDLLLVLRGRGDLSPDLNLDDATMVVFCVFNQHYEFFVSTADVSATQLFADMSRRIRLLFRPWIKR